MFIASNDCVIIEACRRGVRQHSAGPVYRHVGADLTHHLKFPNSEYRSYRRITLWDALYSTGLETLPESKRPFPSHGRDLRNR